MAPAGLVFLAGLGSGVTEAVLIITPADVCEIRMQAQKPTSLVTSTTAGISDDSRAASSTNIVKYIRFLRTAAVIVREKGVGALYKGLAPTVLRQGSNQVII